MYLENTKLKTPGVFSFYGIHCDNIKISGVEIRSFGCTNGDGLDFDGSRNVRISDCILETGDDSISLKTLDPAYPCENFVISNCIMKSRWAALRIGPESSADMRNCSVTNCVFQDCNDGLKIQTNSGGIFEDFNFSNITMRNVRRPVLMTQNYFRMGSKDPGIRPVASLIRRVHIDGITAYMPQENPKHEAYMVFTGMPAKSIQDISLNNLNIVFYGGGTEEEARRVKIPELLDYTEYYFEARYFLGSLPAAGIYLRHINGFKMTNSFLRVENADARPLVFANHLQNARFAGISGSGPAAALIRTALCENTIFRDCDLNGSPADYPASTGSRLDEEIVSYTGEALEVEAEMAAWAADTDAAECSRLYRRLPPETFSAEASESAGYSVRFNTQLDLPGEAEPAKFRTWLYFPAVRGNIQVNVDGRIIGTHRVPPEYQRRYSWALDLTAYLADRNLNLTIDAEMPGLPERQDGLKRREGKGKWFGLLLPPEIGREDGGNRETEGRVSLVPDIFGTL
jgi:hypothetical protein